MTFQTAETWDKAAKRVVKSIWADISLVARVRDMWGRGVSAREIAAALCRELGKTITRESVMGLCHRRKFESPMSRTNKPHRQHGEPRPRRANHNAARKRAQLAVAPKPDWRGELKQPPSEGDALKAFGKACGLMDRTGCAWPLGDVREPGGVTYCNAETPDGLHYCIGHARVMYRPHSMPPGYGAYAQGGRDGR